VMELILQPYLMTDVYEFRCFYYDRFSGCNELDKILTKFNSLDFTNLFKRGIKTGSGEDNDLMVQNVDFRALPFLHCNSAGVVDAWKIDLKKYYKSRDWIDEGIIDEDQRDYHIALEFQNWVKTDSWRVETMDNAAFDRWELYFHKGMMEDQWDCESFFKWMSENSRDETGHLKWFPFNDGTRQKIQKCLTGKSPIEFGNQRRVEFTRRELIRAKAVHLYLYQFNVVSVLQALRTSNVLPKPHLKPKGFPSPALIGFRKKMFELYGTHQQSFS
jgi:hypothetical protein